MSVALVILAIGLTTVLGYPSNGITSEEDWTVVPDGNGQLRLISLEQLEYEYELEFASRRRSTVHVKFTLYTKANPITGEEMIPNDPNWLANSNFNPENPTRVICHGWMDNINAAVITQNRDAYLGRGNFNVIGIDWSKGGGTLNYIAARKNVNEAASQIAMYLDFLCEYGLDYSKTYLLGHSLGAHVAGMVGKYVKNGRIDTIYGMDPALPLFSSSPPDERLAVGDAKYVETIQTNCGRMGFSAPIGDATFYPNWGRSQPGCGFDLFGSCAHDRSWGFLAESIWNNQFYAVKCENYEDIKNKNCADDGDVSRMGGEPSEHSAHGVYYLPTNQNSPYALGQLFFETTEEKSFLEP